MQDATVVQREPDRRAVGEIVRMLVELDEHRPAGRVEMQLVVRVAAKLSCLDASASADNAIGHMFCVHDVTSSKCFARVESLRRARKPQPRDPTP
jgi:hypothetical protein